MAELNHVRRIMVSLWGERVGMIVPVDSRQETFAFQYDRKFLKSDNKVHAARVSVAGQDRVRNLQEGESGGNRYRRVGALHVGRRRAFHDEAL